MHIAISSSSAAVKRTLTELIKSAGYELGGEEPALTLVDMLHPDGPVPEGVPQLAISEPVRPAQLAQSITVKLAAQPAIALAGGWQLFTNTRQLSHSELSPITLTEKECLLLATLARLNPQSASREALLKEVWAYDEGAETHTLETHIYRLRAKLNALHPRPCDIVTVEGSYRLAKE